MHPNPSSAGYQICTRIIKNWTQQYNRYIYLQYRQKNSQRQNRRGNKRKSPSSKSWLQRHQKDYYVQKAQSEGMPSRSIYKIQQMDNEMKNIIVQNKNRTNKNKKEVVLKDKYTRNKNQLLKYGILNPRQNGGLFSKGDTVIDLGAAPGGWSIYTSQQIGSLGTLISVDLLPLPSSTSQAISSSTKSPPFFASAIGDFTTENLKQWIVDSIHHSHSAPLNNKQQIINEKFLSEIQAFFNKQNQSLEEKERITMHLMKMILGRANTIISDMAPNFTGDQNTDALRTMSLCEDALIFSIGTSCLDHNSSDCFQNDACEETLLDSLLSDSNNPIITSWKQLGLLQLGGTFVCKYFSCGDEDERDLKELLAQNFQHVDMYKPHASRKESAEQYVIASGFHGNPQLLKIISCIMKLDM